MLLNGKKFDPYRYSSGELKLSKKYLSEFIDNDSVEILYNNDIVSLFELLAIINYYKSVCSKVSLVLGYLPYQRMNHSEGKEVETVKYVAQIFNSLNLDSIKICEPHCNVKYFNNGQKICLVEKIFNQVKNKIGFDS